MTTAHKHNASKFGHRWTDDEARAIAQEYAAGGISQEEIARREGVANHTVNKLLTGATYGGIGRVAKRRPRGQTIGPRGADYASTYSYRNLKAAYEGKETA